MSTAVRQNRHQLNDMIAALAGNSLAEIEVKQMSAAVIAMAVRDLADAIRQAHDVSIPE